ncbi:hypothetical protein AWZ03_003508 [Drosophila navojoa]|uniref:Uncharacterized protein n=1 Tax=Drosophila navojoa TaxID=7232 RepID=A0A484BMN4_DRONA|nr:hypothetical protein AWZ03_003508 [Drosophila navojoa]
MPICAVLTEWDGGASGIVGWMSHGGYVQSTRPLECIQAVKQKNYLCRRKSPFATFGDDEDVAVAAAMAVAVVEDWPRDGSVQFGQSSPTPTTTPTSTLSRALNKSKPSAWFRLISMRIAFVALALCLLHEAGPQAFVATSSTNRQ